MLEGAGMTDPELAALFPYIMFACGFVLIATGVYGWYRQKKRMELMDLERVVK